jgi:hypothetical protein
LSSSHQFPRIGSFSIQPPEIPLKSP